MAENFIDHVRICCRSGNGGAGSAHFHRDRLNARGGPDGGDGGRGGHIVLKANKQLWTLLPLKYRKHIQAGHGESGGASRKTGASGKDVILEVPLGTVAIDAETKEQQFELTEDGQEAILLSGGMGGRGNFHFKSPTNQAPRYAQPGTGGEERWKVLELKVLADVGLVGFPNAGKSTLLASVSAAKPKIANYPFTTLVPNLGIVPYRDHRSFIMADIPGIIEDAHKGKGLGYRFLKHIERNAALLFLVPADSDDIVAEYKVLLNELRNYNKELLVKERLLAISKSDMLDDELKAEIEKEIPEDIEYCFISSVAQQGLVELKDKLWEKMQSEEDDIHNQLWD
jgi:GTP-binding protein